ncbi:GAF domain-containing protein [Nocardioides sp.]|uniref:GAF domain-containing protein n=1 Tax=Nocardioides sp. TaxID=35761 RepID=UPI0039E27049
MLDSGRAWTGGEDPKDLARTLHAAHEEFVSTGVLERRVRPLVAKSWVRSMSRGFDPERSLAPVELVDDDLERRRESHPLAPVMPVIRRLLVEDAADAGMLVAVSDAQGRLLWVEGAAAQRRQAEAINFTEGARWSESVAGTNAPGTALALDQPVQIFAWEHLSRSVARWSCSAAPIHDPDTGAVLGALDVTGGDDVAAPQVLAMVRATCAAVEAELSLRRVDGARETTGALRALGRPAATLRGPFGTRTLSLRHSEIVTLLALHPEGLTGDQLGLALYERDPALVSVRAELSRLRPLLGLDVRARPYRLATPMRSDVETVRSLIRSGRLGDAVDRYPGPLLPTSTAPGIVRLRESLHEELRTALLRGGDVEPLARFAGSEHGLLDLPLWQALESRIGSTPQGEQVRRHLTFLDRELES